MGIEMVKLDAAINFVDMIANGVDPISNQIAQEDSVLNNPEVIRQMFFIKDVLDLVARNKGFIGRKIKETDKDEFPIEVLDKYVYQGDKPITKVVEQMNQLIDSNRYQKMSYKPIRQWLKLNGFIEDNFFEELNKNYAIATEKGEDIGIYSEQKSSSRGGYYVGTYYSKAAQEFLMANMDKIISGEVA